jgi:DNA-binding transcriptional LysR family regulator
MFMSLRDVDVRHLVTLAAVAEEGSFGRAAAALGFSQAAVSQQVAALERAVGMPLFDRPGGPRPARLTPAGELLLEHATTVLEELGAAERRLDDLRAGVGGRLRLGTFQSVSVKLLPRIISDVRRESPAVDIELHQSDDNAELLAGLAADEFDLSFVLGPVRDPRWEVVDLCVDPFVAVVAARDCPIAEGAYPLQLLDNAASVGQDQGDSCQRLIDDGLRDAGVSVRYVFRSNDNSAVQAMVAAGMRVSILPLLAVDLDDPSVHVHPLTPAIPPRRVCLARRRGRTLPPVADRFAALAVHHSAQVSAEHLAHERGEPVGGALSR